MSVAENLEEAARMQRSLFKNGHTGICSRRRMERSVVPGAQALEADFVGKGGPSGRPEKTQPWRSKMKGITGKPGRLWFCKAGGKDRPVRTRGEM